MIAELHKILNWSNDYNAKLKSPIWDAPHKYHLNDMMNIILQIHDGTFDEDLFQISDRVSSIEKISRQTIQKIVDSKPAEEITFHNETVANVSNPYLKRIVSYINKSQLITTKSHHKIPTSSNNYPIINSNFLMKDGKSKSMHLQHIQTTNASIIPLNTDCLSPINILPSIKDSTEHAVKTTKRLTNAQMDKNYTYIRPTLANVSDNNTFDNQQINFKEKNKRRKLKNASTNICNLSIYQNEDTLVDFKSSTTTKHTKQSQDKIYYDHISSNKEIPLNTPKEYSKICEISHPYKHIVFASEENSSYQTDTFGSQVSRKEIFNEPTNDAIKIPTPSRSSKACQTIPYNVLGNVVKPENKVNMKTFLNLYNISIDPEFMEEELERLSLRLYERINYYMANENISLDVDRYLQQIYEESSYQAKKTSHHVSPFIDSQQDSYKQIPNEILNDSPSAASEILLDSIVDTFENPSYDINKTDMIDKATSFGESHKNSIRFEDRTTSVSQTNNQSVLHYSKDQRILNESDNFNALEAISPMSSNGMRNEIKSSITYSEDFIPISNSSNIKQNMDSEGGIISDSASHANDNVLETIDNTVHVAGYITSSISQKVDIRSAGGICSNDLSHAKQASHYATETNIGEKLKISVADDSAISVQKESMDVSEGELINLSESLTRKDVKVCFQDEDLAEVGSPALRLSDLSVVANNSLSLETGCINVDQSYSEADATISSGQMVHVIPPTLQFQTEEMFSLYKQNEVLRQRVAFLKRNKTIPG